MKPLILCLAAVCLVTWLPGSKGVKESCSQKKDNKRIITRWRPVEEIGTNSLGSHTWSWVATTTTFSDCLRRCDQSDDCRGFQFSFRDDRPEPLTSIGICSQQLRHDNDSSDVLRHSLKLTNTNATFHLVKQESTKLNFGEMQPFSVSHLACSANKPGEMTKPGHQGSLDTATTSNWTICLDRCEDDDSGCSLALNFENGTTQRCGIGHRPFCVNLPTVFIECERISCRVKEVRQTIGEIWLNFTRRHSDANGCSCSKRLPKNDVLFAFPKQTENDEAHAVASFVCQLLPQCADVCFSGPYPTMSERSLTGDAWLLKRNEPGLHPWIIFALVMDGVVVFLVPVIVAWNCGFAFWQALSAGILVLLLIGVTVIANTVQIGTPK